MTAQVNRYPDGRDASISTCATHCANKPYDQMARENPRRVGNERRPLTIPLSLPPMKSTSPSFGTMRTIRSYPLRRATLSERSPAAVPIHDTYDAAAFNVARDFLGVSQMDCILCHDGDGHLNGLSVWGEQAKRSEAWGLAAFFAKTGLVSATPCSGSAGGRARSETTLVGCHRSGNHHRRGFHRSCADFPASMSWVTTTGNRPERQPRRQRRRTDRRSRLSVRRRWKPQVAVSPDGKHSVVYADGRRPVRPRRGQLYLA